MPFVNEYFEAYLTAKLESSDVGLPVSAQATADLLALLPEEDDYTYLTIMSDVDMETVRVRNDHGTLVLERGLENTKPSAHPYGSCVRTVSPTLVAAVKDLVCNYQCCEGPCQCTPVAYSGGYVQDGVVATPWEGAVAFSGDLPMTLVTANTPPWMRVQASGNVLLLSGTPEEEGTFNFSVAATNCNGTAIATQALTIKITA